MTAEAAGHLIQEVLQGKGVEVGTQEGARGAQWPAKERTVPWGKGNPGDLAEPKSSLNPLSNKELSTKSLRTEEFSLKPGSYVKVDKDTWRAPFNGIIKRVNEDGTLDIKDPSSGWLYEAVPEDLVKMPIADGRPIAPQQQRRIGDPYGMMDSPSDVGGRWHERERNPFHAPKGHETDWGGNYPSIYHSLRKEASAPDLFYSRLISKIIKEYGKDSAKDVIKYIEGGEYNFSNKLLSGILHRFKLEKLL